ncbi:hypothetical protein JKA74_14020 [Marivirga sp. S37H4]|uniref:Lipoprotein n=1 Tax=Marivirga aurantiaca TaxID=2802615 RepID=A0A935CAE7_9BACT|nr:hypothetical protein [Marivirga aurantiaca]MBK6266157.1 hypothetical protein [Marivirga aurantiaca]
MMQQFKFSTMLALAIMLGILFTSCDKEDDATTPDIEEDPMISVADKGSFGSIIVDAEGNTLYFFANDADGASACKDGCLDTWPVYYMENITVSEDLNKADFTNITREDGDKQTTYKGWPLYYFASDESNDDTKGDGVGNVWYVAKPDYSLMVAKQEIDGLEEPSTYLVDASGVSLYYFANDGDNLSNCEGGCLDAWPAFFGGEELILPSVFNANQFDVTPRTDGEDQNSYSLKPLYYYVQDAQRGEVKGHAVPNWEIALL